MFDSSKAGKIENEKVRTILNTLGLAINDLELEALLEEEDKEGNRHNCAPGSFYQVHYGITRKAFHGKVNKHKHFLTSLRSIIFSFPPPPKKKYNLERIFR
jgi:hypothetical protein